MTTSYVCLRCSRHLFQPNGPLRQASFVSLGKLVDREGDSKTIVQAGETVNSEPADTEKSGRRRRKSFAQQYQEQRKPAGVDKVLETLFSSARSHDSVGQTSRYSRTPREEKVEYAASEKSMRFRLLELQNQLQRRTSRLEYIWASCQQLLGEELWNQDAERAAEVRTVIGLSVFRDILLEICKKQRLLVHGTVVTPASAIETYRKHGVMRYWWHYVIWTHLQQVITLKSPATNSESKNESRPKIRAALESLCEVWSMFIERYKIFGSAVHIKGDAYNSIAMDGQSPETASPYKARDQFLQLLPQHPNSSQASWMTAGAVMTLKYLNVHKVSCSPLLGDFLRKIRRSGGLNVQIAKIALSTAGMAPEIIDETLAEWKNTPSSPSPRVPLGERKSLTDLNWKSRNAVASRLAEIDKAAQQQHVEDAINLWQSYRDYLKIEQNHDEEMRSKVFARFLYTFWAMRRSEQAIEVWNCMVQSDQKPDQTHWNAMLAGCVRARDVTSLRRIWVNMSTSKLKPDIHSWTTYIHGLIKLFRWQEGLEALELFGRSWRGMSAAGRATTPDKQHSLKNLSPMLSPVRAALSALRDIEKPEVMPTVIAWAESQKLKLDTFTFNILLKPLVRTGTQAQIQSHLARMAEHQCIPDARTFTIILGGLVSNKDSGFHDLPTKAQESAIISKLEEMEDKGIPPVAHTYSVLIRGLLREEDEDKFGPFAVINPKNVPTARTILAYMQKRDIIPSPHLYTSLMNFYFQCSPPDLPAINSLWESIRLSRHSEKLDALFYNRMIEGYASADEIEKALQFLRRMPDEGKSPGWWALQRVLAALQRTGEWELCRELVRDVEDPKNGLLKHGQAHHMGKRDFYELVDSLKENGVLKGDEG